MKTSESLQYSVTDFFVLYIEQKIPLGSHTKADGFCVRVAVGQHESEGLTGRRLQLWPA